MHVAFVTHCVWIYVSNIFKMLKSLNGWNFLASFWRVDTKRVLSRSRKITTFLKHWLAGFVWHFSHDYNCCVSCQTKRDSSPILEFATVNATVQKVVIKAWPPIFWGKLSLLIKAIDRLGNQIGEASSTTGTIFAWNNLWAVLGWRFLSLLRANSALTSFYNARAICAL